MAKIITETEHLTGQEAYFAYNAIDCCVTHEVFLALKPQIDAQPLIYNFERAMQTPALEMMLRGFLIDPIAASFATNEYESKRKRLQAMLDQLATALWGLPLNPNSPAQLKKFFYDFMGFPEIITYKKGIRKVATDREALEKLSAYLHARPFVNIIIALRDCTKILSVLRTGIDPDGRLRASYNVAGTETGRWSSSENAFGTGTNLQNITARLRELFVADPGMKMAYCDLEQAESRFVGIIVWKLFSDPSYIDACESGDLHTLVCKLIWPDLAWTNTPSGDKKVAKQIFYHEMSYRDMAKRGGHGTNYYGQPNTMAKHLKVDPKLIESFQQKYFSRFAGIRKWHKYCAESLQLVGELTSLLGRKRIFFGRQNEDSTLREAIAFEPQGGVGDLMNLGIWRLQHFMHDEVQLLAQVHDAVVFQYPEVLEDQIIPEAIKHLQTTFDVSGRPFTIPVEAFTGWNWGYASGSNVDGMKLYFGNDQRKRTVTNETPILHRVIR